MADVPLKIPLSVFKKMLHTLSIEELKKLPPQNLPREVPNDILRDLDDERREVVDDLMFEVNSHHIEMRLELEKQFGDDVLPALEQADKPFSEVVRPSFVTQVQEYVELVERHTKRSDSALIEDINRLGSVLIPQAKSLAQLRHKISEHKKALIERFSLLKKGKAQFEESIEQLKKQEQLLDVWLGKLFGAKLEKIKCELQKYQDTLQKNKALAGDLDAQIESAKKRINVSIKAMGLKPSEVNTHHFIQSLRADINELEARRGTQKLLVPESALIELLDGFVDASLSPVSYHEFAVKLKDTKKVLFELIQLYCGEQSKAIDEVIGNQFSMASQAGASDYSLKTEHFILEYFTRKTAKLSGNKARPEQLDALSEIEEELLSLIRG